jgi:hypothetical protein
MSQPPNWPPSQPQKPSNPFSDQGQSPFGPGAVRPADPYAPGGAYSQPGPRLEDDPAMRWVLPVGQSVWSIVAGYLGLFSLLCFPAPLALICGIVAVVHLRKNPRLSGWGRAIFGIVMGTLGSAFLLLGLISAFTR